jgi:tetratricopeptide (TPR) repeat protein
MKVKALELRGKGADGLPLLKAYAAAPGAPPERALLYAGLLGRLGRVKEAIDVCEQARAKCPPEAVGGASVAVLRAAQPKPGQPEEAWRAEVVRVEKWLRESTAKHPATVGLKLQLADLMDATGRGSEIEPLYREVLQREPRNHVALNNLAWQLSRRPERVQEALTLIQRAVDVYGPRAELLDTRGVVYLALGQIDKALADLERAVADTPTPAKYFHLTQVHHRARNTQAARSTLARATAAGLTEGRLHPAERDAYRRLAAELKQ